VNCIMYYSIRLAFTVIVIIVIIYILFKFRANKNSTSTSLEIMKERLEKGEITEDDYKRAKRNQGKE